MLLDTKDLRLNIPYVCHTFRLMILGLTLRQAYFYALRYKHQELDYALALHQSITCFIITQSVTWFPL
jgi:hypothetical protein